MKRDLEHDKRSGWRIEAGTVGLLMFVAFVTAFILALFWLQSCSNSPPPCVPTRAAAIVAECRMQYRQAGCASDPERLCPELVRACDARIDSLSDWEICQP